MGNCHARERALIYGKSIVMKVEEYRNVPVMNFNGLIKLK